MKNIDKYGVYFAGNPSREEMLKNVLYREPAGEIIMSGILDDINPEVREVLIDNLKRKACLEMMSGNIIGGFNRYEKTKILANSYDIYYGIKNSKAWKSIEKNCKRGKNERKAA